MKLASSLFALSLLLSQGVAQSKDLKPSSLRKAEVVGDVEKEGHDLSLLSKTVDVSHSGRNLQAIAGGTILPPGDYTSDMALSLTGIVYLDPEGDSNAEWTFTINGAFTTAADSHVIFLADSVGDPANVHWVIKDAAASLGADSYVVGTMDVGAAVTVGAGGTIGGAVKAGGAVTAAAGSNVLGAIDSDAAVTLGADSNVDGIINAVGAVTLGADAAVDGSITSDAAIDLGANAKVNGTLLSTTDSAITVGSGATYQTPSSGASGDPHCKCSLYSQ
jgi:cytoskeletal protein CcmA (bactofilin family)